MDDMSKWTLAHMAFWNSEVAEVETQVVTKANGLGLIEGGLHYFDREHSFRLAQKSLLEAVAKRS